MKMEMKDAIKKGTQVKLFTSARRKYEGVIIFMNNHFVYFRDATDNKNRIVSLHNVAEIEVGEIEGCENGEKIIRRENSECY
jgi:hypothetical protein